VRSLQAATRIDLGFDAPHYALVNLNLGMYGYEDGRGETFYQDLQQRFRGLPGVEAVTMADRTPLSININTVELFPAATTAPGEKAMVLDNTAVEPGFFDAMRIPIIEGRAIGPEDTATSPRVGVVSESMARRVWPGQSAVGKQMRAPSGRVIQIVGVSRDYK